MSLRAETAPNPSYLLRAGLLTAGALVTSAALYSNSTSDIGETSVVINSDLGHMAVTGNTTSQSLFQRIMEAAEERWGRCLSDVCRYIEDVERALNSTTFKTFLPTGSYINSFESAIANNLLKRRLQSKDYSYLISDFSSHSKFPKLARRIHEVMKWDFLPNMPETSAPRSCSTVHDFIKGSMVFHKRGHEGFKKTFEIYPTGANSLLQSLKARDLLKFDACKKLAEELSSFVVSPVMTE